MLTSNQNQSKTTLNNDLFHALRDRIDNKKIESLLEQGADINVITSKGNSPLHVAIKFSSAVPIIKMLLKHGTNVNALDHVRRTPLHTAALYGQVRVTKELLINGADVNIQDRDGMMPLELIINANTEKSLHFSKSIIFLLLAFGANVSNKVKTNYNPVQKNCIAKFERIERDYPHYAKLMKANKDPKAILQYNENTEELYKEFQDIRDSYDNSILKALQSLRQCVLKKLFIASKSNFTADVPIAETSLKRSTAFEDQNIPLKKRKLKDLPNTEPSSRVMIPNIPNKMINILEVIYFMGP